MTMRSLAVLVAVCSMLALAERAGHAAAPETPHAKPASAAAPTNSAVRAASPVAAAGGTPAREKLTHVEVEGPSIRATKVLGPHAPDISLGPSPLAGNSRILPRSEMQRAFESAGLPVPSTLPDAIRVTRKVKHVTAQEMAAAIRETLSQTPLGRGATLIEVRAQPADLPAEYTHIRTALPSLPRRAGRATVQAVVEVLDAHDVTLQKLVAPIEISLPPEAAVADISRGQTVQLVVRRGLVEVSLPAVATADADIGSVFTLSVRPSGRVVRARAIDKDHALALEDS